MLDLTMCKRLKAAGFPQPITPEPSDDGRVYSYNCDGRGDVFEDGTRYSPRHIPAGEECYAGNQREIEEIVYCPTIEDLIFECQKLSKNGDLLLKCEEDWVAKLRDKTSGSGFTPEEALANLYLKRCEK